MKNLPLPRLDRNSQLREYLLKYCRIGRGEVWSDPAGIDDESPAKPVAAFSHQD